MPWDINPATLALIIVQSVAVVVAFVRAYDGASEAKRKADEAAHDLDTYKRELQESMDIYRRDNDSRHNLTAASIALIREQFVRKEDLKHLEESIARQFEALQKRLDVYFLQHKQGQ